MRVSNFVAAASAAFVLGLGLVACGGGGSSYGGGTPPTNPTPQPPPTGQGIVSIMGDRGAQSFSPNPGAGNGSQMVQWRNNDTVAHRIVLNNNAAVDTGNIAPGATSAAIQVPAEGANYHCTIHPGMIGSIQGSGGAEPPPCNGQYC
jgi:plastocyanin